MPTKLGIVAGSGVLPARIAQTCRQSGREFFVLALEGQTDPELIEDLPHAWVHLGSAGKAIDLLHREQVHEIVMAGAVRRPSLAEIRPDMRTAKFVAKGFLSRGDDGLLGAIVKVLEDEEDFKVIGVQDILGGVLVRRGHLGAAAPTARDLQDIERGVAALNALAQADVGQAIMVQDGIVLGIEAVEGTDQLIARCAGLRREGRGPVLVKLPKRGQEHRVDLPTIGPGTVASALKAGCVGIAVAAGETLIIEADQTIEAAEAGGLFVLGLTRGET